MSKISYEKCICFIFLVILVILSCSGFPIDNVAMSDNSKKSFRTSSSSLRSDDFLNRFFNLRSTQNIEPLPSHKLRHLRQLRAQTRDLRTPKMPMGHIEAIVFPNDDDSLSTASEMYAQIPSTDTFHHLPPTKTINTRSQRSYNNLHHRTKTQDCQPEHFSTKAYKAEIVLHVKAQIIQSQSSKRKNRATYSVYFKVFSQLKNSSFPIHDMIHLQFSNSSGNCEREEHRSRKTLVKADIRASQEYILFLNASSANKYSVVGAPEWISRRRKQKDYMMKILNKICSPNFNQPLVVRVKHKQGQFQATKGAPPPIELLGPKSKCRRVGDSDDVTLCAGYCFHLNQGGCGVRWLPTELKPTFISKLEDKSSWRSRKEKKRNRLKLICRAMSLPFPRISWRRDNVTLTNSTHVRISYVKRRSTLVIRHPTEDDFGRYECVARGVDGAAAFRSIEVQRPTPTTSPTPFSEMPSKRKCEPKYAKDFCLNDGQCFMDLNPFELYCECPNGFTGKRCAEKTSYQPPISGEE